MQISFVSGGSVWRGPLKRPAATRRSLQRIGNLVGGQRLGKRRCRKRGSPADPGTSGHESRDVTGLPGWWRLGAKAGAGLANFNLEHLFSPEPIFLGALECFLCSWAHRHLCHGQPCQMPAGWGGHPGDDHGGKVIVALCIVMRAWRRPVVDVDHLQSGLESINLC